MKGGGSVSRPLVTSGPDVGGNQQPVERRHSGPSTQRAFVLARDEGKSPVRIRRSRGGELWAVESLMS